MLKVFEEAFGLIVFGIFGFNLNSRENFAGFV